MTCLLTFQQILVMQRELNALGYPCTKTGTMSGSTRRAFVTYHQDRNIPTPDLNIITEAPVLTAISPAE